MPTANLEQDFPGLRNSAWRITSEADPRYNCVAFAVHDTRQFWDANLVGVRGYYWPPGVPRDDSLASWVHAFEMNSYRVCADTGLGAFRQRAEQAINSLDGYHSIAIPNSATESASPKEGNTQWKKARTKSKSFPSRCSRTQMPTVCRS